MKRPFALVAVWVVAAAAAVGVGFLAVSLIDASASPPSQPGPPTVSGPTSSAPTASGPTESVGPSATTTAGEQSTAGGTVYATCVDGSVQLAGAPAAGWTVETSADEVEFRSGGAKIEVRADCSTGSPQFAVEDHAAGDDHGGRRGGHGSDD